MPAPRATSADLLNLARTSILERGLLEPETEPQEPYTVAQVAGYVLSLPWPGSAVTKTTLVGCLPAHERQRELLQHFLRFHELRGHLAVGRVMFLVTDAEAMRVAADLDDSTTLRDLVNVGQAVAVVEAVIADEPDQSTRARLRTELRFLESLRGRCIT
jgi:hypothetical protein